jgi:hypothetical protein
MQTDSIQNLFGFQDLGAREVVADFHGGMFSSDAGGLILRKVAVATDLLRQCSSCFHDYRNQMKHSTGKARAAATHSEPSTSVPRRRPCRRASFPYAVKLSTIPSV